MFIAFTLFCHRLALAFEGHVDRDEEYRWKVRRRDKSCFFPFVIINAEKLQTTTDRIESVCEQCSHSRWAHCSIIRLIFGCFKRTKSFHSSCISSCLLRFFQLYSLPFYSFFHYLGVCVVCRCCWIFRFYSLGAFFFFCLVVDAVICIILILERDQWGQTLSGCQPYFSVLCCNRLCLRCRNYRALQLQPHTYVDRPYTHRINRNAKQTESERMNDRRIERANFVIAAKTVATVTQTFIIFNTTTCTFLHASRWMTPKTKYKILLHIHTDWVHTVNSIVYR